MSRRTLSELDSGGILDASVARLSVPLSLLFGQAYVLRREVDVGTFPGLVHFADTGLYEALAVDLRSGAVVKVGPDGSVREVSPSCEEFVCVAEVIEAAFETSSLPMSDQVGALRQSLDEQGLGSLADADGYWSTLLDDIEIGDFDDVS